MEFTVTPSAEKFIRRMIRISGQENAGFRMVVSASGCSGLAAEFSVESAPQANDATVDYSGLKLFLPAQSRLLLDGVIIDFSETPMESGFVFRNPKAGLSCCGGSTHSHAPAPAAKLVSLS